jgi:hypothetical protein
VIAVTAPIWIWKAEKGSWHFLTVPAQQALEVRLESAGTPTGFGSVRVEACINGVRWRTSLFPDSKSGGYLLPIKADVRRKADIAAGDLLTAELCILA